MPTARTTVRAAARQIAMSRQQGFTLLELLISSIIFAIMAVMAYGGLNNVIRNSDASKQALSRLQQIQQSVAIISRDFSQISPRAIRDEYGNRQPYVIAGNKIDQLIEFTRGGRVNPASLPRSSLLRVAYQVEEDKLIRLQWPQLDRAQGIEPKKTVILDQLEEITLRFLNASGKWGTQWPPLNNSGTTQAGNSALYGIEIVLELEDWGKIRRVYALN